jgi:hypothetical protein
MTTINECDVKLEQAELDSLARTSAFTDNPYADALQFETIDPLFQTYRNLVKEDRSTEYDPAKLQQLTETINNDVSRYHQTDPEHMKENYPYLYERAEMAPLITVVEIQAFANWGSAYGVDYYTGRHSYEYQQARLFPLLNLYYGPSSFVGSGAKTFCSIVPEMFGMINRVFDAFGDMRMYARKADSFINKLKSFDPAKLLDKLTFESLLEGLKKSVGKVVKGIIDNIRTRVNAISSLFMKAAGYGNNKNRVAEKMHAEKTKADRVTSEEFEGSLTAMVEGAISFAISVFDEFGIDELMYVIKRICELISGIEAWTNDQIRGLKNLSTDFTTARNYLSAAGSVGSIRAIRAGAIRIPGVQRHAAQSEIVRRGKTNVNPGGTPASNSSGRNRSYVIDPITEEELDIINSDMTVDRVLAGTSQYVQVRKGQSFSIDGKAVWEKVQLLEKVCLLRLAKRLNKKILVTSAFRSAHAQSIVNPSVKASWHSSGQAFDVAMSSYSGMTFEQFRSHANACGFSRVRPYNGQGFVHIDTGPPSAMW